MDDRMQQDREWHLDKKVPLALIVTLLVQSGAFIWWAAKADSRLDALERTSNASAPVIERVVRLETKVDAIGDSINDMKVMLRIRSLTPLPPQN
jgi:hypothetical protein